MNQRRNFQPNAGGGQKKVKGLIEQAMGALRADDIDTAESLLEGMLEENQRVPHVYLGLARCAMWRENLDSASEYVQTALSINQDLPGAYNLRGEIHMALGDDENALGDFERAVELRPTLVKGHINLARSYLASDQLDLAREHCETAIELEPQKDSIRLLLCKILEQSGDLLGAQEETLAAVKANPANTAAYLRQGKIAFKQKDLLQAEKAFESLVEVKPDSMVGYFLLGMSAFGLAKYQLAERSFLKSQELLEENVDQDSRIFVRVKQQLAFTYLKQGKLEEALVAAKTLSRESKNKRVLKLLADIYYEMEQYELASQHYRAFALSAKQLSSGDSDIQALLDFEGDAKEVADSWRTGFSQLKSRRDVAELSESLEELSA
jgi:tetratricopeptide (TPR) repeat protein